MGSLIRQVKNQYEWSLLEPENQIDQKSNKLCVRCVSWSIGRCTIFRKAVWKNIIAIRENLTILIFTQHIIH